jgi:signal transduction histidine kinase/integral membrane sensor domain MASE1
MRALWPILLTAAGYYVAGRLSLLLAIPPGYATAVWPPAGLALAAVLLGGYRVWPGILLGSFLVNVGISFDASSATAILRSLLVAGAIGGGATLQAVLASGLIRRFIGYQNILTQAFGAVGLLLLGGPLACLLNATLAVSALWLAGLVPGDNYLFNWWTWWVGDSIGVLIFTPLVLVWALRPAQQWRRQQLAVTVPMALMFAGMVALFVLVSQREAVRVQVEFEKWADSFAHELEKDLGIYRNMLSAVTGLFSSSEQVTNEEFDGFGVRLLALNPEVQALSWNPRVTDAQRDRFEAEQQAAGYPGYRIYVLDASGRPVRAPRKPEYFPAQFTVPYARNARSLGFDISSEAERRAAIERATAGRQAVGTGPVRLVQREGEHVGVLILEPVYRPVEGRETLQGFAVVVIHIADIMRSALERVADTGLHVQIHDVTDGGPPRLIFASAQDAAGHAHAKGLQRSDAIDVAGRQWRVAYHVPASYLVSHRSWQAWSVLAGGLLFTALLGVFLLLAVGYTSRVETEVEQRTAELNRLNAELQKEIGERARLQYEADQRAEQLADKNQELERFAYVVSHDLQAPLRGITGFTELLAQRYREQFDAEGREFLQYIVDGAAQMRRMIADILALSRVGSGALECKPVDVAALVERVRAALRVDIQDAQAQLECGPLPVVPADEGQLFQLFQNLIGNAIKFRLPQRPPVVRIHADRTDQGWHFQVADNGIGIPKDKQDRLFSLFVRLHTAEEYVGTGLGLAICKRIVERHGGRIWLESEAGQGTVFHFVLPAAP